MSYIQQQQSDVKKNTTFFSGHCAVGFIDGIFTRQKRPSAKLRLFLFQLYFTSSPLSSEKNVFLTMLTYIVTTSDILYDGLKLKTETHTQHIAMVAQHFPISGLALNQLMAVFE